MAEPLRKIRRTKEPALTHEDDLIKQFKKGRQECLDELIRLYYPVILRYCLWHMPDKDSAQDAVQETFLKLVRFIGRYEPRGQFRAFLYRIAANTCTDMKRSLSSTEFLTEQIIENTRYEENGFQAANDRQQLATAYCALDNETRELVLLRYGQELTLREIATVTGLPLRTVQTRLRKAVKTMRNILDG